MEKALDGGRAEKEGVDASDFSAESVSEGRDHEMEHTDDPKEAEQIATDHLAEDPRYYRKLKKIEKGRSVRPHFRGKTKVKGYNTQKDFEGLDSTHIYEMAKSALSDGELDLYQSFRHELERRSFVEMATKSLDIAGHSAGFAADPGATQTGDTAVGSRGRPANRDKRIFEDMYGFESDKSSEDISKADLINELRGIIREEIGTQLEKAILTKTSDSRERPVKRAKANPKSKVGANSKGKTYQDKKPGAGPVPPGMAMEEQPKKIEVAPDAKLDPGKLTSILGISNEALASLAAEKEEHEFVVYFETHAAELIKKYEIPREYWVELYNTLKDGSAASEASKSINSVAQFDLNISVYSNGSEMYNVTTDLSKAGVSNLKALEEFLTQNYDVAKSDVRDEASNILTALVSDGAAVMR